MSEEQKRRLISFYNQHKGHIIGKMLEIDEVKEIISLTSFLNFVYENIKMSQRIWHIKNDIFCIQKCIICDSYANYNDKNIRYNITCCKECKSTYDNTLRVEKTKKTNIEKYGVENVMDLDSSKEKIKNTNLERYGIENVSQDKEIQLSIKNTNLEKYGKIRFSQTKDGKQKQKKSCIEKLGVENPFFNEEIYNKSRKTCLRKYGNEYYQCTEEGKRRLREFMNNHPEIKELSQKKQIEICRENYGTDWFNQTEENKFHIRKINLNKFRNQFIIDGYFSQGYRIIKSLGNSDYLIYCPKCKQNFISNRRGTYIKRNEKTHEICTICNPLQKQYSVMEKELLNYIKENYYWKVLENTKIIIPPYEIDIYLPDLKLAFEFNGDYWHVNPKIYIEIDKRIRHIWKKDKIKKDMCEMEGITLITVWESDWLDRRLIVERYVRMILNYHIRNKNKSA